MKNENGRWGAGQMEGAGNEGDISILPGIKENVNKSVPPMTPKQIDAKLSAIERRPGHLGADIFAEARRRFGRGVIEAMFSAPGAHWAGNEYWTLNPTREDSKIGSFHISAAGEWFDHATSEGGDLIELLSKARSISKKQAAEEIIRAAGGAVPDAMDDPIRKKHKPDAVIPIPEEKKHALNSLLRSPWVREHLGEAVLSWRYHMADGGWAFGVVRFEKNGQKSVIPYYFGSDGKWHQGQPFADGRPLYRLPELLAHPELPVLVVEGEKTCDAARSLLEGKAIVTTWAGGSSAVAKTDWSPLIGRVVTIWPDRDDPGRKAAENIAKLLPGARIADPGTGSDGWDAADAVAEGWDAERILAFIAKATEVEDEPEDDREEIQLVPGETHAIAERVLQVLAEAGDIYQFGENRTILVKISHGGIEHIGLPWLLGQLERKFRFLKFDARTHKLLPKDSPERLGKYILDARELWQFPHVRGVTRMPLLRLDGTILAEPGYDSVSELIYAPAGKIPQVPLKPSREEISDAIRFFWKPFSQFPYESPKDRTVAFAAALSSVQRPVLGNCPGFLFDAPNRGTGKTLLAETTAAMGTGHRIAPTAWPEREEEAAKQLFAILLNTPRVILFDNIETLLKSSTLQVVFTSPSLQGRILGRSEVVDVPTIVLFLFSGNNTTLFGDLVRRILRSRLNANMEHPETREFDFDPVELVTANWEKLTVAALTILRGFFNAGAPKVGSGTIGSFEQWDAMIRQAILWIRDEKLADFELTDVIELVRSGTTADPETVKLRALLTSWREAFTDKPLAVRDVIREALKAPGAGQEDMQALHDAIEDIAMDRGRIDARRLGSWIGSKADRIIDGLRFKAATMRDGVGRWTVQTDEEVGPTSGPEERQIEIF